MKMRFAPDEPIVDVADDLLGFKDFADLILASIRNTESPFVYGVLGDWGTGKTSILRMLESQLALGFATLKLGEAPLIPIWFNAWQYENETNVIYPLLYAIKKDYIKRLGDPKFVEVKHTFLKTVTSAALALTDLGLRVATKTFAGEAISLKDVKEQIEYVEQQPDELESLLNKWADQVGQLHNAFESLLYQYAKALLSPQSTFAAEDVRFLILIDDLDRCLPHTVIAMLESIKNYLTVSRCIFVLAVNPSVVYEGIRTKYQGGDIDGREYLEKILTYSFYVPEPDVTRLRDFAFKRLEYLVVNPKDRQAQEAAFKKFGEILEACRFNNPRKIKRILNRYLLFIEKYHSSSATYDLSNIIRFIILAEYFPELYPLFLAGADAAKEELKGIGTSGFDLKDFEQKTGIPLSRSYKQLSRMNKLFDLKVQADPGRPTLTQEAQAVFTIARLI